MSAGGARLRELLEKKAESLHDRLLAVPFVEWCYCGHPHSAHRFYDNKIYDVQGYTCPDILGGEFRLDSRVSAAKQRAACIQLIVDELEKALEDAALLVPPSTTPEWFVCFRCWRAFHVPTTGYFGNCDECGKPTVPWQADALKTLTMTEWRREKASLVSSSSPAPQERETNVRQLSDDCLVYASSVERQNTPWAAGCAAVLRQAACSLRELNGRLQVRREADPPVSGSTATPGETDG